ncbi:MAG: pilus assembly protein TadG-related protein [Rhizobiaceae bacterium]
MVRNFLHDKSGQFAIMFSFVAIPVLLAVGIAVDYTNLLRVRDSLQSSADAAVLAVAQKGDTISDSEANTLGDAFVDDNFDPTYTNLNVTRLGTNVDVTAKTKVQMAFGGLFGLNYVDINVKSSAAYTEAVYEIALALDTTGSMAGKKLNDMKDAVEAMVDNMAAQNPNAGALKFSVVPFSSMVNVGANFGPVFGPNNTVVKQPAYWLDALAKSPIVQSDLDPGVSRFAVYKNLGRTWPGCIETRPVYNGVDYGTNDVKPDESKPETLYVPTFSGDDDDSPSMQRPNNYLPDAGTPIATGTPINRMARYGAVYAPSFKSLSFNNQIAATSSWTNKSGSLPAGNILGPGALCDLPAILPLTSNFTAVKAKVNSLVASGHTNIFEGTMWGWRTLSSREPFAEGAPSTKFGVKKFLVVLTDGTNTLFQRNNNVRSTHSNFGYLVDGRLGLTSGSNNQVTNAMNAKTLAACANAKADGIEIFTIRLEEPNVMTGNMLKNCASSPSHYIDVPDSSMLEDAFKQISKRVVGVRLGS